MVNSIHSIQKRTRKSETRKQQGGDRKSGQKRFISNRLQNGLNTLHKIYIHLYVYVYVYVNTLLVACVLFSGYKWRNFVWNLSRDNLKQD